MNKIFYTLTFLSVAQFMNAQDYPAYNGPDLGLTYTPKSSTLKVWSPIAKSVTLRFYAKGFFTEGGTDLIEKIDMDSAANGIWHATVQGDRKGQFYTYQVTTVEGKTLAEVPDIYAKAVGANGKRAQVVDLKTTNPKDWDSDKSPVLKQKTDAILYELHIRDASIAANSGIKNKGKFLGLTEKGTKYSPSGGKGGKISTGLDHIVDLGVTHVHLLPTYDFFTIDEAQKSVK